MYATCSDVPAWLVVLPWLLTDVFEIDHCVINKNGKSSEIFK